MNLAALLNRPGAGVALLLIFYLFVAVLFSVLSPWFLSFDNMMSIGANMAFIGLMCALQTPLIIAGGLDLSVAAVAGLAGVVVALLHAAAADTPLPVSRPWPWAAASGCSTACWPCGSGSTRSSPPWAP